MEPTTKETTQTPEELVRAFIWAMFEWETSAFEIFEEQVDQRIREKREEGETFIQSVHDAFAESGSPEKEKGWHFIVRNFCTEKKDRKCPGYSSPPRHNPVQEKIVSFSLDPYGDALIRTRYASKDGSEETRNYVLTEEYGVWLISDIYSEIDTRRHQML